VNADDHQLVMRAKRGDEEAFRTLMERYRKKVFSIAYGMVRNQETALDICQEVFIKVHRYLESFQGTSSFYTWLYRISINLSIDFIRKQGKSDAVEYDDAIGRREPDDAEAWIVPTLLDHNPLQALNRKELGEHLSEALATISEKHRAILLLREVEGLSYEDIARTLKIHKGTVMSRLHHARKNLQRAMRQYLEERGDFGPLLKNAEAGDAGSGEEEAESASGA
jgi:RNA polymerase sigma-70 factor, ECF subfamily